VKKTTKSEINIDKLYQTQSKQTYEKLGSNQRYNVKHDI